MKNTMMARTAGRLDPNTCTAPKKISGPMRAENFDMMEKNPKGSKIRIMV